MKYNLITLSIVLLLLIPVKSNAQNRIALVIGNADYLSGPLKNTVNDARSMSRVLRNAGFEVMLYENVSNKDEFRQIAREFSRKLKVNGTALFYYSGHGLQVNGFNYLVPVNAVINSEEEVEYECMDVGFVLALIKSMQTGINIVILDACRNNPFARSFRDTKQGLVSMTAPTGTIIAFSTSPGSIASDGDGVNGLYTQELLGQINNPGLKVEDVFKNVRREVLAKSEGKQTPWESSSLVGDFYFTDTEESFTDDTSPTESDKEVNTTEVSLNKPNDVSSRTKQNNTSDEKPVVHRSSYTTAPFKWKATPDGKYFVEVNGVEISEETSYEIKNEDLYVYHDANRQVFVLKSFIYRMDNKWRKGK